MAILSDQVVLVTGAGSGIGRQTALAFAREGAAVVVADRVVATGQETVGMIHEQGGESQFVAVDVTKSDEVRSMVEQVLETYDRLDVAANIAGIGGQAAPLADSTEDDWDQVIDTNLKGVWLCMKFEIPPMVKRGRGAIVNMASVLSQIGQPDLAAYVASKHGVLGLTRQAALEYAKLGLRVNAVSPVIVDTPMTRRFTGGDPEVLAPFIASYPAGRIAEPEEVADPIVWLCTDAASYINGHSLVIDGGFTAQ